MDRKVVLALGLSLLILVAYQSILSKYYPQTLTPPHSPKKEAGEEVKVQKEEPVELPLENLPSGEEIIFENNLYKITFTDVGGAIKKITLNKNPKAGLNVSYDVLSAASPFDGLSLFLPDDIGYKLNNVKYNVRRSDSEMVFTHDFNGEFVLEKKYIFHNSLYQIELELVWKNLKGSSLSKKYSLITSTHLPASSMDERFLEIAANIDGKVFKNKKAGKPYEIKRYGNLNWIMLKNRYFSIIAKSFNPANEYIVQQSKSGKIISAITVSNFEIPANSSTVQKYGFYIGPSDFGLAKEANIGLEGALSYGFLGSIGQILMSVLRLFYKLTRNWGVAIMLLAFFINIVLFPLTRKSYKSMQEMQILQPKIEKLRQEHKNNPQKLQKEIVELYKKYKINPMGGCLPLILQMPIFFALYQGLINFIELRGAKFLWIKDLSVPENIRLPFTLPLLGTSLNILPLVMLIVMFFQQRLTNKFTSMSQTDEQRKQQKFMMIMMTIMFGFIFYNMPSGFVLYWLSSSFIMTVIQVMLTRAPKPVPVE